MAILTPDMKRLVATQRLCYVATVGVDGRPNLSPKGTLSVVDDDHLAFVDIMSPNTVRNLRHNPFLEINVVDPFRRCGYRFKCRGEVVTDGPLFTEIAASMSTYPVHSVIKARVEAAAPVRSPVYTFEPGVTEDVVKARWLERYGYREAPSRA